MVVVLDERCLELTFPAGVDIIPISTKNHYLTVLAKHFKDCDLFWPIAPETDGILVRLAEFSARYHIKTLLSGVHALALCSSKHATNKHLRESGINAVETIWFTEHFRPKTDSIIIKPDDGAGSESCFIVDQNTDISALTRHNILLDKYIVQPYIPGKNLSLSCLFKHGHGWLLTINAQHMQQREKQLQLSACSVNISDVAVQPMQHLINRIASAIPDLWGYIGIDLIYSSANEPIVIEINPRLTTSFAGIHSATGINVAEQVLNLLTADPEWDSLQNNTVTIKIH